MEKRSLVSAINLLVCFSVLAQCSTDFSHTDDWETLTFTNLSSVPNAHYYWNFGDGSTSYDIAPTHAFPESGRYLVTLLSLDTVSQCHSLHQEWIDVVKQVPDACNAFMTDSLFTYNGSDYVQVSDGSSGCDGMSKYIDAGPAQNFPPGNWIGLSGWHRALFLERMRYVTFDSINGAVEHRQFYRTLPYNDDQLTTYDTCSANFEYAIDYQPDGAHVQFTTMGPPGADTIWITGFGNPLPLVGHTSSFVYPYYGGLVGHWSNVWRRNTDVNHGCNSFYAQTLIVKDPYYEIPPSCQIDPEPTDQMVAEGANVQFIIETEDGTDKQWQQNAGLGWQDLMNAGPYSGVHTDTLTIANVQNWWNNYQYRCVVTALGSYCHNTSAVAAIVIAVGIDEFANVGIGLFPNPATDVLNLQWDHSQGPMRVSIIDALGKEVMNDELVGTSATLNISTLDQGVYLLSILVGERRIQGRFIKQ